MRFAAFTVDVDRDVNLPLRGQREAISREREGDHSPRFRSSGNGLLRLIDLLDEVGIKGTFFLEAETAMALSRTIDLPSLLRGHEVACHGWAHEDLTGESSGVPLSAAEVGEVIERSVRTVKDIFSQRPLGFRAPYQHVSDLVLEQVAKAGLAYDSSVTVDILDRAVRPYRIDGLTEVPVARGRDLRGKRIVSYMWPFHESKRPASDYKHLLTQYDDGLMVLATHSWHVMERYSGPLERDEVEAGLIGIRDILLRALDQGIEFMTIAEYLRTGEER